MPIFQGTYVPDVEAELETQYAGRWTRLDATILRGLAGGSYDAGWTVDVRPGEVQFAGIDRVLVAVDRAFPASQPKVFAPQAPRDFSWPHVEAQGALCLKSTRVRASARDRIAQHLAWALELLSLSADARRNEFAREFGTYWQHRCATASKVPAVKCLLKPHGDSRLVVFAMDASTKLIVVAETKQALMSWMQNTGYNVGDKLVFPTYLVMLDIAWSPNEFPEWGRDVLAHLPAEVAANIVVAGRPVPVVFGAETESGVAFAATLLTSASERDLTRGFRRLSNVPRARTTASFANRPALRCPTFRIDAAWVHGRDHDNSAAYLSSRSVAVVGCGSIGAALVRLLAQAGVGSFVLIDNDVLAAANTSRHALGNSRVGTNKAEATASMLRDEFPHLRKVEFFPRRAQALTSSELDAVSDADLIVSAGIDFDGDAYLDTWRRALARPPPYLSTWVEAFAQAGHAVLLFGADSLIGRFDDTERPDFRLTEWPHQLTVQVVEAGCGNVFQPHGAIDLQFTVAMAASLATKGLLDQIGQSWRYAWLGDRDSVIAKGGYPLPQFDRNCAIKEYPWRARE